MSMMLYKDFISNVNDNPVKDVSDETIQAAMYDWFKYRYIGFENTDKFLDILQRNVKVNYPMYQQKLRIEPGVSQYDWLVSLYRERQLKTAGTTSKDIVHGDDSVTYGHKVTDTPSGTESVSEYGDETRTRTGGHLETDVTGTHTRTVSPHVQTKVTRTGTEHNETVRGTETTTTSPHVKRVRSEDGGDSAWSGDSQISAQLPMSKSYTDAEFDADGNKTGGQIIEPDRNSTEKQYYEKAYQHMPALDWNTATSQAQSGHREYHDSDRKITDSYVYGDGVEGDIVKVSGDKDSPETAKHYIDSEDPDTTTTSYIYEEGVTGDVTEDKGAVDNPDTRKIEYNGVLSDGTSGERETVSYNGRKTEKSFTDRKTIQEHSGTDRNSYGNITESGADDRTDREQVTGRNEDPATLLARATAFIERSSAWLWFREQIECCFYPGYYTDDVTEEGSSLI